MKAPESRTALVVAQSTALVRKAAAKLAKRGLGELWLLDSAEEWFEKAKYAKSQNRLSDYFECLQRTVALAPEHLDGLNLLGLAYHNGIGTLRDQVAAIEYFRGAAERGHAEAQYHLGLVFELGHGVPRDLAEGIAWQRKAAEQGHSGAQYRMGAHCKAGGRGGIFDHSQSVEWYRKAAEQGHAASQYELGNIYRSGQSYHYPTGVVKNLTEAAGWYRKAANLGHREAQFSLSYTLEESGSTQDRLEAMEWLHKLVDDGDRVAQKVLGDRYYWGNGVQHDLTLALVWYQKAAEQGESNAIYNLARLYAEGDEVPRDLAQAAFWYRKAVDLGLDKNFGEAESWLDKHAETGKGA